MFRLKATLVATTLTRPWRTGWPVDRGVDFSLGVMTRPLPMSTVAGRDRVAAEEACFIGEDWTTPSRAAVVRTYVSKAAADARPEDRSGEAPETSGLRAWWSLSGKPSGA